MTEAESPRRAIVRVDACIETSLDDLPDGHGGWRQGFLDALAETSNVTESAAAAGIDKSLVYRVRRTDGAFARAWCAALDEGYLHLEMETLGRLRMGVGKDEPKYDLANALRLLSLHRDRGQRERGEGEQRDEAAIIASIDAKLERIRARQENVARLLHEEGINAPRLSGGND